MFEAREVAGSATNKQSKRVWGCFVVQGQFVYSVYSVCLGINTVFGEFSLLINTSSPKLHSAPLIEWQKDVTTGFFSRSRSNYTLGSSQDFVVFFSLPVVPVSSEAWLHSLLTSAPLNIYRRWWRLRRPNILWHHKTLGGKLWHHGRNISHQARLAQTRVVHASQSVKGWHAKDILWVSKIQHLTLISELIVSSIRNYIWALLYETTDLFTFTFIICWIRTFLEPFLFSGPKLHMTPKDQRRDSYSVMQRINMSGEKCSSALIL